MANITPAGRSVDYVRVSRPLADGFPLPLGNGHHDVEHKRERGERVGTVPFGYQLAADGRTIEPREDGQRAVSFMRALRASGPTLSATAAKMKRICLACVLLVGCGRPSAFVALTPLLVASQPSPKTDTWLISGQSNAVGCAPDAGPAASPFVQLLSGAPAVDPLPFFVPYPNCNMGAWTTAADDLAAGGDLVLHLTGAGQTSAPIAQWADGAPMGIALINAATTAGHVDWFLWYQGEADATLNQSATYAASLRDLVGRVRVAASSPATRVLVVGLADAPAGREAQYAALRAAQQAYVASDPLSVYVTAEGLPLQTAEPFHLTRDGYVALGHRISAALRRLTSPRRSSIPVGAFYSCSASSSARTRPARAGR